MTTPASPNPLKFSDINTEVGNASDATLNMGNSKLRGLFQDFSGDISMSSGRGKTYTIKAAFSTAGATTFVVPTAITSINVKLWGAGGGGGGTDAAAEGGSGGSGAYVTATIAVTPGETLNIFVPSGGLGSVTARVSGAGGSWAGIFRGGNPLVIAGGGGGGGPGRDTGQGVKNGAGGGAGGGLNGADGGVAEAGRQGRGGTTTAGGQGGTSGGLGGEDGALYKGGDGAAQQSTTVDGGRGDNGAGAVLGNALYGKGGARSTAAGDRAGGGGGGAGYYGGGGAGQGGNNDNSGGCGGGGGSSFYSGAGVSGQSSIAGNSGVLGVAAGCLNDTVAPNNTDTDYIAGVGIGLRAEAAVNAGPGLVVIRWSY